MDVSCVAFPDKRIQDYIPRISKRQIEEYGFEGFLIDLIDASPAILVALCERSNVHQIASLS